MQHLSLIGLGACTGTISGSCTGSKYAGGSSTSFKYTGGSFRVCTNTSL